MLKNKCSRSGNSLRGWEGQSPHTVQHPRAIALDDSSAVSRIELTHERERLEQAVAALELGDLCGIERVQRRVGPLVWWETLARLVPLQSREKCAKCGAQRNMETFLQMVSDSTICFVGK